MIEKKYYGFTVMQIATVLAMAIFVWYSIETNKLVPNRINVTINGTPSLEEKYIYAHDDLVPRNYLTRTNMILGFLILGGIVLSFMNQKELSNEIDIEEARIRMEEYMKNREYIQTNTGDIIKIGDYQISPNFFERFKIVEKKDGQITSSEEIALKFVLEMHITDLEGMSHYVKGYVHPFKGKVIGFISIDQPLVESDQCPKCGNEFDVQYINTEDFKKMKAIKGGLTSDQSF